MIRSLAKIEHKKGDTKVMCDKFESLMVKYQNETEILDNDTIVTHLFWCLESCTNQNWIL